MLNYLFPVLLSALLASPMGDSGDPARSAAALVSEMIDAHGGTTPWEESTVAAFTHIAYMPSMPGKLDWMISRETFEQTSRRGYAEYPHWDARVANDNTHVWSTNWPFPNRPSQMLGIHYYFAFLPWLSQDEGVVFGEVGEDTIPGDKTVYTTVPFWYASDEPGKPDTWTFYIHPDTRMMAGFSIEFGPGKAIHRIDAYSESDGLTYPADFVTYAGPQARVIGHHVITAVDLHAEFDEARLKMPEGAVIE